jgi:hypothetical protein
MQTFFQKLLAARTPSVPILRSFLLMENHGKPAYNILRVSWSRCNESFHQAGG